MVFLDQDLFIIYRFNFFTSTNLHRITVLAAYVNTIQNEYLAYFYSNLVRIPRNKLKLSSSCKDIFG